MITSFEEHIQCDLQAYLRHVMAMDERWPECPDVEEMCDVLLRAYLPDGMREFGAYPTASLGWMMYIGMAVAHLWDTDWDACLQTDNLYVRMRDKRGYDLMDEYICDEVLALSDSERARLEPLVGECASRCHHALTHQSIEPGSREAFDAYVSCLRQLYRCGAAIELHRLGYRMTPMH